MSLVKRIWEDEGKLIVHHQQDVEPILEDNKKLKTQDDGYSASRELRRVARIPNIVVDQWLREGVNVFDPNDRLEVMRRLNSPEWAHLRTAEGKL